MNSLGVVLLDLPMRALVNVLTHFTTLSEIGRLDSALCSRSIRKAFTTTLSTKELTFAVDFARTSCMLWSIARNVKFSVMNFSRRVVVQECVMVEFFEKQCKHVKEVHETSRVGSGIAAAMQKISESFKKLQVLDIRGTAEPQHVACLLNKCPNLVRFDIYGIHYSYTTPTESYFIGAYCPSVTSIQLSGQFHVDHLTGLTACFPNINALEALGIMSGIVSESALVNIIVSYRNLRKLALCDISTVDDRQVSQIARGCPNMTQVTIASSHKLTHSSITALCAHCPLQSFELINCDGCTNTAIAVIATELRNALADLSIAQCTKMRDLDLASLKRCTLLESLDISYTGVDLRNLSSLLQTCTQLRMLKMDNLAVTDDVLCAVAKYCAHVFHCISIVDCSAHTKVGILALAKRAHSLEEIVAGFKDPVLSDLAKELMKEKFPRLRISPPPPPQQYQAWLEPDSVSESDSSESDSD